MVIHNLTKIYSKSDDPVIVITDKVTHTQTDRQKWSQYPITEFVKGKKCEGLQAEAYSQDNYQNKTSDANMCLIWGLIIYYHLPFARRETENSDSQSSTNSNTILPADFFLFSFAHGPHRAIASFPLSQWISTKQPSCIRAIPLDLLPVISKGRNGDETRRTNGGGNFSLANRFPVSIVSLF